MPNPPPTDADRDADREAAALFLAQSTKRVPFTADVDALAASPASPPQPVHKGERATCCDLGRVHIESAADGGDGWVFNVEGRVFRIVACPFCGVRLDAAPAPKPDPNDTRPDCHDGVHQPGCREYVAPKPETWSDEEIDEIARAGWEPLIGSEPFESTRRWARRQLREDVQRVLDGCEDEVEIDDRGEHAAFVAAVRAKAAEIRARRSPPPATASPATGVDVGEVLALIDQIGDDCGAVDRCAKVRAAVEQLARERDGYERGMRAMHERAAASDTRLEVAQHDLCRLNGELAAVRDALIAAVDGDVEPGESLTDTVQRLRADLARVTGERAEIERLAAENAAAMRAAGADLTRRDAAAGLLRLLRNGGRIVSTGELPEFEIAKAGACGRMWVDADHFGYVFLPPPPAPGSLDIHHVQGGSPTDSSDGGKT